MAAPSLEMLACENLGVILDSYIRPPSTAAAMLLAPPSKARRPLPTLLSLGPSLTLAEPPGSCASLPASPPASLLAPYSLFSTQQPKWFFFFKSKPDQITSAQMLSHLLPVETRVRPMASAALCHLRSCPPISRISTPLQGYTNMPGMCSSPWPFRGLGWFPSQIAVQLTLHILEVSLQMSLPQRSLFWSPSLLHPVPQDSVPPWPASFIPFSLFTAWRCCSHLSSVFH